VRRTGPEPTVSVLAVGDRFVPGSHDVVRAVHSAELAADDRLVRLAPGRVGIGRELQRRHVRMRTENGNIQPVRYQRKNAGVLGQHDRATSQLLGQGAPLLSRGQVVEALLRARPAGGSCSDMAPPRIVEHDVTLASEFFPDDACGPRAVTETVTNTVQVNHLTARADGSFHFVDFETGFLFADYVDPTIPDQTFRRTNTEVFNLTPGGTFIQTETLQQFDATLRITSRVHLTVVGGEPKVEREVFIVRGCL
jgi:hypothetical protein